jgi:molybdopterin-containing oxidoreductase family iron-sulfur binding subunit
VCPTRATWKRDDGIVMMDYHRCIGCRYCMGACPYGSRSFNWDDPRRHMGGVLSSDYPTRTKGVVEKCTFCEERLAKRQRPLCVEACPEGALVFGDLADSTSQVRELLRARHSIRRKPELGTQPAVYYVV